MSLMCWLASVIPQHSSGRGSGVAKAERWEVLRQARLCNRSYLISQTKSVDWKGALAKDVVSPDKDLVVI